RLPRPRSDRCASSPLALFRQTSKLLFALAIASAMAALPRQNPLKFRVEISGKCRERAFCLIDFVGVDHRHCQPDNRRVGSALEKRAADLAEALLGLAGDGFAARLVPIKDEYLHLIVLRQHPIRVNGTISPARNTPRLD